MLKTLNKLGIEENYLNVIKAINNKFTTNIILNGERLKSFHLRSKRSKDIHFWHFHSTQYWKF